MTPDDREFGILIGKVEAIGEQLAEMRRSNSVEHAGVISKLDEVRADVSTKASEAWVEKLDTRVDSLEKTRDEGSGFAKLVKVGQGAATVGLMLLTYLATKGGV